MVVVDRRDCFYRFCRVRKSIRSDVLNLFLPLLSPIKFAKLTEAINVQFYVLTLRVFDLDSSYTKVVNVTKTCQQSKQHKCNYICSICTIKQPPFNRSTQAPTFSKYKFTKKNCHIDTLKEAKVLRQLSVIECYRV